MAYLFNLTKTALLLASGALAACSGSSTTVSGGDGAVNGGNINLPATPSEYLVDGTSQIAMTRGTYDSSGAITGVTRNPQSAQFDFSEDAQQVTMVLDGKTYTLARDPETATNPFGNLRQTLQPISYSDGSGTQIILTKAFHQLALGTFVQKVTETDGSTAQDGYFVQGPTSPAASIETLGTILKATAEYGTDIQLTTRSSTGTTVNGVGTGTVKIDFAQRSISGNFTAPANLSGGRVGLTATLQNMRMPDARFAGTLAIADDSQIMPGSSISIRGATYDTPKSDGSGTWTGHVIAGTLSGEAVNGSESTSAHGLFVGRLTTTGTSSQATSN